MAPVEDEYSYPGTLSPLAKGVRRI